MKLKVYGWITFTPGAPGNGGQVRAVCAAKSAAEVARIAGVRRPSELFNLSDTGNDREIRAATLHPGKILVTPTSARCDHFRIVDGHKPWDQLQVVDVAP